MELEKQIKEQLNVELNIPTDPFVGYFQSNGSANGKSVYKGARGGFYYLSNNGGKRYLNKDQHFITK